MTFNELVAWIIAKPFGRILIERSESKRDICFFLSCQAPDKQVVGLKHRVPLEELRFLRDKEQIESFLMHNFDAIKEDFEVFVRAPRAIPPRSGA